MRHPILAALLGAALLAGCGDEPSKTASGDTTATIRIKDFKYSPDPATVKARTVISVVNEDRAPHTLTDSAQPRAFDSGSIIGTKTGSVAFAKPGTYKAFCELHPYMKVTVRVVE